MTSRARLHLACGVMALLALGACGAAGADGRLPSKDLTIVKAAGGEARLRAEIADSDESRARGLMFRKKLSDGEGMLFVFDRDQMMSFWMKNTLIPLSIAYIASDGRILELHDMEPGNLNPVRSSRSARYALEVPAGWFDRAGVTLGDRLSLP